MSGADAMAPGALDEAATAPDGEVPAGLDADGSFRFAGYAALFDKRDAGRDTIRPGAFARTLAERREPLPLYWQHRPDLRIGWIEQAREDERGLAVIATIDNGLGLLNQAAYINYIITGSVLLLAASVDAVSRRRRSATGT